MELLNKPLQTEGVYITGIWALNLPCELNTCGDWHTSSLDWNKLSFKNIRDSFFGTYGIETNKEIPFHKGQYNVANHIRALLDMLLEEQFCYAQGMRDDYICTSEYNTEIFEKVQELHPLSAWKEIDSFMSREYFMEWIHYKKRVGI